MTVTSGITHNEAVESAILTDHAIDVTQNDKKKKKKKKGGPFSFFRAALVVLRSDSKKKSAQKAEVAAPNENWKKIVGSMRPLHLHDNHSLPPKAENLEDLNLIQQPSSPAASSVSGGTMSQYASASNLQELDESDGEEEDPDEVFDAMCGDETIDAKAEEFIAQFYQQMKIQHVGAMRRTRESSPPPSLGILFIGAATSFSVSTSH